MADWRHVARQAWSIRLALIAAALGGLELLIQYLAPERPSGLFIALGVLVNVAAAIARIVAQPRLYQKEADHADDRQEPQA